jgi:hypothetical protein
MRYLNIRTTVSLFFSVLVAAALIGAPQIAHAGSAPTKPIRPAKPGGIFPIRDCYAESLQVYLSCSAALLEDMDEALYLCQWSCDDIATNPEEKWACRDNCTAIFNDIVQNDIVALCSKAAYDDFELCKSSRSFRKPSRPPVPGPMPDLPEYTYNDAAELPLRNSTSVLK